MKFIPTLITHLCLIFVINLHLQAQVSGYAAATTTRSTLPRCEICIDYLDPGIYQNQFYVTYDFDQSYTILSGATGTTSMNQDICAYTVDDASMGTYFYQKLKVRSWDLRATSLSHVTINAYNPSGMPLDAQVTSTSFNPNGFITINHKIKHKRNGDPIAFSGLYKVYLHIYFFSGSQPLAITLSAWYSACGRPSAQNFPFREGIQQLEKNDVIMAPNPFKNKFTASMHLGQSDNISVEVMDLAGKVVHSLSQRRYEAGIQKVKLDLRHLPAGAYIVRFHGQYFHKNKQILKIE